MNASEFTVIRELINILTVYLYTCSSQVNFKLICNHVQDIRAHEAVDI